MHTAGPKIRFILVIDLILILLSFAGVYQLSERAAIPATFTQKDDGVYFRKLGEGIDKYIFQPDDKLVSIDAKPVSSATSLDFILDAYRIGDTVDIEAERNTISFVYDITLTKYYDFTYLIIVIIVGLLYWGIAVIVLVKRPGDKAARVFHYASIMVAMIIMNTWGRYTIEPMGIGYLIRFLNTIAYILTPVLFVHFILLFPRERNRIDTIVKPLYAVAAVIIGWITVTFLLSAEPFVKIPPELYIQAYRWGRILFSACVIYAVVSIQYYYFKTADESERRKLRWVMLGLGSVPLVFIGLWQLPQTFMHQSLVQEEIIILVSALIPITFGISIVRYHIFDIDRIFSRATVYTIVIALLLTLYVLIVGAIAELLDRRFELSNIMAPATAAVIIALLFEPLRRSVQRFIDRTYFRVQYNYREALKRFTDEIEDVHDTITAAAFMVQEIERLIPVTCIGIITTDEQCKNVRSVTVKNIQADLFRECVGYIAPDISQGLDVYAAREVVEHGVRYRRINHGDMPAGISLIVTFPLNNGDRRWFLLVGQKMAETRFSIEDVDLITFFVRQGAIVIDRILLQRKLILEQKHAQQLEELNRLKSFFVSSVSHDLKTPLTSIRMFAEMLQAKRKNISNSEKEYLEIIQGESDRLARLIDNVLEFTKIERGLKEYHKAECNLNHMMESVLKIFRYQFIIQNVSVKTTIHRRELMVLADYDSLVQVVTNLLANAIKYSPGKKNIKVATGVLHGHAYIKIADKGIGIYPEDVKNIFKPFYRSVHFEGKQPGGVGLGLALVQHIVKAHNGSVEVRSTSGKGSTFTVSVPIHKQTSPNKKQRKEVTQI